MRRYIATAVLAALCLASVGSAKTSHAGWPQITGMLLTNKDNASRPLDARPGHEPFAGTDSQYSCDSIHPGGHCKRLFVTCASVTGADCPSGGLVVSDAHVHNELLGGHGSDTIHAGPLGDVIWGDENPSGQPASQHDVLVGGAGKDFIYASHGVNTISGGGGPDRIKAHFGGGTIDCGAGNDLLYISHVAKKRYKITHCETISFKSLGF